MVIEGRETSTMIGSDKVEGTGVYGPDNQKIGEIERVMIEKTSGRVSYAVLGFGGFLGIGNDHYPLPWDSLSMTLKSAGTGWVSPRIISRTLRSTRTRAAGIGTSLAGLNLSTTTTAPHHSFGARIRTESRAFDLAK
jgi:hypothetical protein